jgi:hypothetical protein
LDIDGICKQVINSTIDGNNEHSSRWEEENKTSLLRKSKTINIHLFIVSRELLRTFIIFWYLCSLPINNCLCILSHNVVWFVVTSCVNGTINDDIFVVLDIW